MSERACPCPKCGEPVEPAELAVLSNAILDAVFGPNLQGLIGLDRPEPDDAEAQWKRAATLVRVVAMALGGADFGELVQRGTSHETGFERRPELEGIEPLELRRNIQSFAAALDFVGRVWLPPTLPTDPNEGEKTP